MKDISLPHISFPPINLYSYARDDNRDETLEHWHVKNWNIKNWNIKNCNVKAGDKEMNNYTMNSYEDPLLAKQSRNIRLRREQMKKAIVETHIKNVDGWVYTIGATQFHNKTRLTMDEAVDKLLHH